MFSSTLSILMMVLGFGFLIFIHELGHFAAAKWAGIRTEGFAVGMGPVLFAWRRGIGLTVGASDRRVVSKTGKPSHELSDEELEQHGIGETEYSLRILPFGGFVKMLGQDDARPGAMSEHPRSYTRCSVGKRMIVVSAGVIMNVILAAVLFVIAFSFGVQYEAAIVGGVSPGSPAAEASAVNADDLGITEPGLQIGDEFTAIDGDPVESFRDVMIAAAMSKPEQRIKFTVRRANVSEPLDFVLMAEKGGPGGLRSIGVAPAASTILQKLKSIDVINMDLAALGLTDGGVEHGMMLVAVDDEPVSTYEGAIEAISDAGRGMVKTTWSRIDDDEKPIGTPVDVDLQTRPQLVEYQSQGAPPVRGLAGLAPLVQIDSLQPDSPNSELLRVGDLVARAGSVGFPREEQFRTVIADAAGGDLDLVVIRDGERVELTCAVSRQGQLGIMITAAIDTPITAAPIIEYERYGEDDPSTIETATTGIAGNPPLPGTRVLEIAGQPIADWIDIRETLRAAAADMLAAGEEAREIELLVELPTPDREQETLAIMIDRRSAATLDELGWSAGLYSFLFESLYVERSANGNPIKAISMGIEETKDGILLTYLTIDRLFRGSVSVDQLRGPVGIVDLGTDVFPRGIMYFLSFLGLISVNLAVLNFLPLPIVDGGLFLFLIYEKIKGRPPSVAFQNGAFLVGIVLLGALFLYITFNDVQRLF